MITERQAADIRSRHDAIDAWLKANKRNSYRMEELESVGLCAPTNDETSALEVFEFCRDKPDHYFLYVRPTLGSDSFACTVGTWTGEQLGAGRMGHVYRSNMGDKRRSIHFRAITGDSYAGTYFCGAGDYARVRKVRS